MSRSLSLVESPLEAFAKACKMPRPMVLRATNRLNGTSGDYTIFQPFAFLGRAQSIGVRLDDPSVSQCHCYLQVMGGLPYLTDLGSRTGLVWPNGRQTRGWLFPNETVQIGAFDLQFNSNNDNAVARLDTENDVDPAKAMPHVELEILRNGTRIDNQVVSESLVLIGRHPSCQLRLLVDDVTYYQCALINTADGLWCLDYLSPKGTRINGRQSRLRQLRDGDLMEFGKTCLVVHFEPVATRLATDDSTGDEFAPLPTSGKDAIAPFREVADQFQTCFMSMVQMFTAMQQEHASMACEQLRLMQELLKEVREMRLSPASVPVISSVAPEPPAKPASASTPPPPRKKHEPADEKMLQQAHEWFMDRLKKAGQVSGAKSN